jgi:hypothetical protein
VEIPAAEKLLEEAQAALQVAYNNARDIFVVPAQMALSSVQQLLAIARQELLTFEQAHKEAVDVLQYIADYTLSGLLIVNSASFTAQYSAISDGRVSMNVNLNYMGRNLPQQIEFDFYHPDAAAQSLANKLLSLS